MDKQMYIYRIGLLKKDNFTKEVLKKIKYNFIISSSQDDAYKLALEPFMSKTLMRTFKSADLKRIARAYGMRILKWTEVGIVNDEMFAFHDAEFKTTIEARKERLEKSKEYIKEVLNEKLEDRNSEEIRSRIAEIDDTIGYTEIEQK
jgi:hypothetical protein